MAANGVEIGADEQVVDVLALVPAMLDAQPAACGEMVGRMSDQLFDHLAPVVTAVEGCVWLETQVARMEMDVIGAHVGRIAHDDVEAAANFKTMNPSW